MKDYEPYRPKTNLDSFKKLRESVTYQVVDMSAKPFAILYEGEDIKMAIKQYENNKHDRLVLTKNVFSVFAEVSK